MGRSMAHMEAKDTADGIRTVVSVMCRRKATGTRYWKTRNIVIPRHRRENCIFRTPFVALRSFTIRIADFAKIGLQT